MIKSNSKNYKGINDNRGSATLECTIILPLFIFGVLTLYSMGQSVMAEAVLYEAAGETIEYMAEYGYIGEPACTLPYLIYEDYVDDYELVDRYIDGGVSGVDFTGTSFLKNENIMELKVNYSKKINLPFIPQLSVKKSFSIKQRIYVGYKEENGENTSATEEIMVYVAENESVYHKTDSCTHLQLSIALTGVESAKENGYMPCSICKAPFEERVYITDTGECYHSSTSCSGLKRTIYKINIKDVGDLIPCSRCGG